MWKRIKEWINSPSPLAATMNAGRPRDYQTPSKLPDGWVHPCREFFLVGFGKFFHLYQFDAAEIRSTRIAGQPEAMMPMAQCRLCGNKIDPESIRDHAYLHLAVELAKAN